MSRFTDPEGRHTCVMCEHQTVSLIIKYHQGSVVISEVVVMPTLNKTAHFIKLTKVKKAFCQVSHIDDEGDLVYPYETPWDMTKRCR